MDTPTNSTITTVLAVLGVVAPVLFGFLLWKLSTIFITRERHMKDLEDMRATLNRQAESINERFNEYRGYAERERQEIKARLEYLERLPTRHRPDQDS